MKILCPIDFSTNSMKALEASIYYSKILDADLHIINVANTENLLESNSIKLKELLAGVSAISEGFVQPIVKIEFGNSAIKILEYSNLYDIDLVIMGTKGYNNIKNLLFGSVTSTVVKKSKVPVLVIPEILANEFNTSMVIAVDHRPLEHAETFSIPMAIAENNDVKIDFLHIKGREVVFPFDPFLFTFIKNRSGEVHIINSKDVVKEVKQFAEKNKVGLLIMLRREKSLLSKLLTVSNTQEELAVTNTPLLVLPA